MPAPTYEELRFLDILGGSVRTDAVASVAESLRAGGQPVGFSVVPANGRPVQAPELVRALALAVVDGNARLERGCFVLTPIGRRRLESQT